jgi:hypothetical protein
MGKKISLDFQEEFVLFKIKYDIDKMLHLLDEYIA